jgi:hypothetical protein
MTYPRRMITKNAFTPTGPNYNGSAPGIWRLDEVAYWRQRGLWPDPSVVPDPSFPYVSLLLSTTALGNANNNLFVDSSGVFNPISRNGNTTQGSFTPYGTSWSNYFDGSGDYLNTAASSSLGLTGDWTVEGWVYQTSTAGTQIFLETRGSSTTGFGIYCSLTGYAGGPGAFGYATNSALVANSSTVIPLNTWTHLAVTRSGNTITGYINGVSAFTYTESRTLSSTMTYIIGADYLAGSNAYGYFSNLRVVRGTAVYTSNFTPPTSNLTAINNTTLLTCQSNRFRDASVNNFTITVNGNTSVTEFSPFAPAYPGISYNQSDITNWSGYFDGSGDYLTAPDNAALQLGSSDFTIEFWVNFSVVPGAAQGATLVSKFNTSNTGYEVILFNNTMYFQAQTANIAMTYAWTPIAGRWYHIAWTRSGSNSYGFIDGALVASTSAASGSITNLAQALQIGRRGDNTFYLNGYMSNVRVVKGTAVYTAAFTPPTAPLTAITNTSLLTCQNAAFTDNSTNNFVVTINGNTTVTGNSPFNTVGYWSNYFDGSGDYLSMPSNAAFAFGTGDYTIEGWIYTTVSGTDKRITWFSDDRHNIDINTSNQIFLYDGTIRTFGTIVLGAWNHFAVSRTSGTVSCYLNGVRGYNASETTNSTTRSMNIAANNAGNNPFNGYISNIRVVKGTGVYSGATITVPTSPLTAITNTSLLTCQNGRFIDNSTNAFAITVNGNTSVQSFDPFYTATIASNGGSMYFDGTGDYLTVPSTPALALGTGDFTWECWIYPINFNTGVFWITDVANGFQVGFQDAATWGVARAVIQWYLTSTTLPTLNSWNHIAVTRSGAVMGLFLNGTLIANRGTATADFVAGTTAIMANAAGAYAVQGYTSNMRLVKGTAIYDPNVSTYTVPTAPANPTPATTFLANGMNAGAYDATAINNMETVGNAQVSTVQSKFGGSSMYFDGTGDYLAVPTGPQLYFGTSDFTVEAWIYPTGGSGNRAIFSGGAVNAFAFYINSTGKIAVAKSGVVEIIASTTTISTSTFTHVAATRSGNTFRIFVNGTLEATVTSSQDFTSFSDNRVGFEAGSSAYLGYIDDLRITKGVARYTTTFTPPTQAFPPY